MNVLVNIMSSQEVPVILTFNMENRMSEAVDIYPLTVEEYEAADEVAVDVEVE
jgi:hypothetical protein